MNHASPRSSHLICWLILLAAFVLTATPAGANTTFTSLYSFAPAADGARPAASLIQGGDGDFYGTASQGGSSGFGTVFKVTPSGAVTTIYDFTGGSDGADPYTGLIQGSDGNFYGTTEQGGGNSGGTIYRITPAGALTTLYSFPQSAATDAALAQGSDGNFYGLAGTGDASGGMAFEMTPAGTLTTLITFSASVGNEPFTLIQGTDGSFYGTAAGGGRYGEGAIIKFTSTGVIRAIYSFGASNGDGDAPEGGLVEVGDGDFYGTTGGNDTYYPGTVFKVTRAGVLTTLSDLYASHAMGTLIQGSDGNLYGTIAATNYPNDPTDNGSVFQVVTDGTQAGTTLNTLYAFSALTGGLNSDGAMPYAGLVQGSDGDFYGTTYDGGVNGDGTFFKFATNTMPPPPVITGFTPASGPAGSTVTITGMNLTGTNVIGFQGQHALLFTVNASGTQIIVTVPSEAQTGPITILTSGVQAISSARFTVTGTFPQPTITGLSPGFGPAGTAVTITGTNLTGTTVVGFMGQHATSFTVSSDGTQIMTTVPGGAQTGPVAVLTNGMEAKSGMSFTVTPPPGPVITSFSPASGLVGTTVTIIGRGLTDTTVVGFQGVHAKSFTVNPEGTQITTKVPAGAVTGPLAVLAGGTEVKSATNFTVFLPPTITGFTPASGATGTIVTITGTNLIGTTAVGFMEQQATSFTVSSDGTQITTTVPAGAVTGPIAVLTNGIEIKSATSFTVIPTPTPSITGFTPASGSIGTAVTITGTNLAGTTVVGFMGQHAKSFTVNAAGTQITTTVPSGAQTGPVAVLTNGIEAKSPTSFGVTP